MCMCVPTRVCLWAGGLATLCICVCVFLGPVLVRVCLLCPRVCVFVLCAPCPVFVCPCVYACALPSVSESPSMCLPIVSPSVCAVCPRPCVSLGRPIGAGYAPLALPRVPGARGGPLATTGERTEGRPPLWAFSGTPQTSPHTRAGTGRRGGESPAAGPDSCAGARRRSAPGQPRGPKDPPPGTPHDQGRGVRAGGGGAAGNNGRGGAARRAGAGPGPGRGGGRGRGSGRTHSPGASSWGP